jgi:copper(I)-binding protein
VIRASSGKSARRLLLGAGVLAVSTLAIAGCEAGNGAPTLEFHAASAGQQTVFNSIRINNVFVLGAPSGSTVPAGSSASLFLSLYNGGKTADTLESITAAGTASSISVTGSPLTLPSFSAVNLTGPQPTAVLNDLTTPLTSGTTVPVTLTFEHAGQVTLQVPVEPASYYWATYSPPASPSASTSAGARVSKNKATPIASTSATSTASPTASASPSVSASS